MISINASDWIRSTQWADWDRSPIKGDASARSYERLNHPDGRSAIFMIAPPTVCGSQSKFVALARHLCKSGIAAPEIYSWDDALGFMVLEDLGLVDFARHLATHEADERLLYSAAISALDDVQSTNPPDGLQSLTPEVGVDMISLAFDWVEPNTAPDIRHAIETELKRLLDGIEQVDKVLSLRDFHAENLIWRPEKPGLAKVGLLDFQDAFLAHPAYDVASLMRDARRDVDPNLVDPLISEFAQRRNLPEHELRRAFHILAVQRNLRIIGIFERLEKRDGKLGYRKLLPRIYGHLRADLLSPDLQTLNPLIKSAFPIIWKDAS